MKPRLKKLLAFYQRRPWIVSAVSAAVGALFGWLLFRVLWIHTLPKLVVIPSVAVVDLIFIASTGIFLASLRNGFQDLLKGD
jgi:hypothetical protein